MQVILSIIGILAFIGVLYYFYRKAIKKPIEEITPPPTPNPPSPETDPGVLDPMVGVSKCVISNKKRNNHCMNVEKVSMEKSEADKLGWCDICKPIIPPPPKPKRPDILIGTSFYQMLEAKEKDIDKFLDGIYESGGNCTEIFTSYTWSKGRDWQPFEFIVDVDDNGSRYRLYDLTTPDVDYWNKLKYIMVECAKRDITLIIRLFDYCSIKNEDYYKLLCWHTNKQKIEAQKPGGKGWGGFYGDETKKYSLPYVQRIKSTAVSVGCTCLYQWINEPSYKPSRNEAQKWIGRDLPEKQWGKDLTPIEKANIVRHCDAVVLEQLMWWAQRVPIVGQSMPKDYTKCIDFMKNTHIKWEVHGCNSPNACNDVYAKYAHMAVPNGDGPDPFAKGRAGDEPSKKEPSVAQGYVMGVSFRTIKPVYYSFFNRNTEHPLPADITRATFDVLQEIILGYLG